MQALISRHAGQYDKARMQLFPPDQAAEVTGILGYDNSVFGNGIAQYHMIRVAPPPHITRMHGNMVTCLIEPHRDLRRQAFINEELHPSMPDNNLRAPWTPRRPSPQRMGSRIGFRRVKRRRGDVRVVLDKVCDCIATL